MDRDHAVRHVFCLPDDLISYSLGDFGLLDDAWLVHNTAFRLIESGLVPAHAGSGRRDIKAPE